MMKIWSLFHQKSTAKQNRCKKEQERQTRDNKGEQAHVHDCTYEGT